MRIVLLLAVLILSASCGPEARPQDVVAWHAIAGEPLSPPASDAWTAAAALAGYDGSRGDGNARATIGLAGDGGVWTWDLAYTGADRLDYGEIGCPAPLPAGTRAVGVRWQGVPGAVAPRLRLRLRDAGGEIHQYAASRDEDATGLWRLAVIQLGHADAVWGGDGNHRLDQPVQVLSLVADRPWRGFRGSQRLQVEAPRVLVAAPAVPDAGLRLEVADPPSGHCYEPGATARLRASLPQGSIRWTVSGLAGEVLASGGGSAPSVRIDIPLTGPGWRECRIEAEDGAARSALAYRCAVLAPGEVRNPRLGVCVHVLVQRKDPWPLEALDLVPRLGLGSVREELAWVEVERPRGNLAIPAHHAGVLARMRELALDPLLILYAEHPGYGGGWPVTPEARAAYAAYAARVAAALPWVANFELWNEWGAGTGVDPRRRVPGANSPESYAALLAEASMALRAVRPDATIVGIGGENITARRAPFGDRLLWEEMLQAGAGAHMDAASFHPYRWSEPPEPTGLATEVEAAARRVRDLGGPARLWITEIGWTSPQAGAGATLREHGVFTVRALALLASVAAVERTWLYDLMDDGVDPAEKEHHFGLFHHHARGLMPKPAAAAVAAFAKATGGAVCQGRTSRDGAWAVRWRLPGGDDLVMAWSLQPGTPVSTVVSGLPTEVRDAAGALLSAAPAQLGAWPVYLRGRGLGLTP